MGNSASGVDKTGHSTNTIGSGEPISRKNFSHYFSLTTVSLKEAADALNVDYSMSLFSGKKYADSLGILYIIICSNSNPFSLGTLRGKSCGTYTATYNLYSHGNGFRQSQAGTGDGIIVNTWVENVSARVYDSIILSVSFKATCLSRNGGSSLNDRIVYQNISVITANGTRYQVGSGEQTVNVYSIPPITIIATARAKNNWPGGESDDANAVVTITSV
jgi:hypothetical protein